MKKRWMLAAALLAAVLLLAACGGKQSGGGIVVEGRDFNFSPDQIRVKAGTPVTITLKNVGAMEHDLVVPDLNKFHVHAGAGRTASATLKAARPGTYDAYCSIPGHKESGMVFKVIVE